MSYILSDVFSSLAYTPLTISAFVSLDSTHFGKLHVVSGTSGTYNINLPAVSGNAGKVIGFTGDVFTNFSTYVNIYRLNTGEDIQKGSVYVDHISIVSGDSVILRCDGSHWFIVSDRKATISTHSLSTSGQAVTAFTTNLAYDTSGTFYEDTHGCWNGSTYTAIKDGLYAFDFSMYYNTGGLGTYYIYPLVNANEVISGMAQTASDQCAHATGIVRMSAGWGMVFHTTLTGTRGTDGQRNKLCIAWIGE